MNMPAPQGLLYTKSFLKTALSRRPWMALLALASVVLGVATYSMLGQLSYAQRGGGKWLTFLLILDLACLSSLTISIVRRLVKVWGSRRNGQVGSRMHSRMVLLFGVVAAAPTLILTVFSAFFFHFGVQEWFDNKFRQGLDNASVIATAYFDEQKGLMKNNLLAVEHDLARHVDQWHDQPENLEKLLGVVARLHGLSAITLYSERGVPLVSVSLLEGKALDQLQGWFSKTYDQLPAWAQSSTNAGNLSLLERAVPGFVGGLYKMHTYNHTYYVLGWRPVDQQIMDFAQQTILAAEDYKILETKKFEIQIAFSVIFGFVSLLVLLGAIAFGLLIANGFARPVANLMRGAKEVAGGSLDVSVPVPTGAADLKLLVEAFNTMVQKLKTQKTELLDAYADLENRKVFIESVLDGVSSGVLELSLDGNIRVINNRAQKLLHITEREVRGRFLGQVFPEVAPFFEEARSLPLPQEVQLSYEHEGHNYTFFVRLNREDNAVGPQEGGYVLTFDDLTEQLQHQRKAAWADVARRIAHEIKNPLTPIQLSAERLKRRCAPQLKEEDAEIFAKCVTTITRQVDVIGGMIREFSNFARMPAPAIRQENILLLLEEAVTFQAQAFPNVRFIFKPTLKRLMVSLDPLQFSQVITNLLKNALEAVMETDNPEKIIECHLVEKGGVAELCVDDNGPGWPVQGRERLAEPYFTTKSKGSGLGLSIVKRVLSDHNALMFMENSTLGGARVRIVIPKEIGQDDSK